MNVSAVNHHVGRKAVVVLDVAGRQIGCCDTFEFCKEILRALADDIDKNIEPSTMSHSNHAFFDTGVRGPFNNGLHGSDEGLTAFETEAFLTDITSVKESLKTFSCRQAFEDRAATFSCVHRSRTTALKLFLPPALLDRIGDVHKFGTNRAAVSLSQGCEKSAQRHLVGAEKGIRDVKLGIEICIGQTVEQRIEFGNHGSFMALERIELCATRTEHAIGSNELLYENLFAGNFQILTADITDNGAVGTIGKARDDFRM